MNTALQSVFLVMQPKRMQPLHNSKTETYRADIFFAMSSFWKHILQNDRSVVEFSFACGHPPHAKLKPKDSACMCLQNTRNSRYDRSVPGFSFTCGLRPHAKLNPRAPLACVCKVQQSSMYDRSAPSWDLIDRLIDS